MALRVLRFPCLTDNYGFLAHDEASGETACIDTPDADAIAQAADAQGWRITQIWNTHHHFDHAGGNEQLKAKTGARVVAPAADAHRIPAGDQWVRDGDSVALGESRAQVIETPGHTLGHIVYHFAADKIAFVGDTLFALGCGRLFEGEPAQMWSSLRRFADWPDDTTIYCAHEYTEANARFALSVDPDNAALKAYAATVAEKRARDEPTVPTTLGAERAANPFLRADDPALQAAMGHAGDAVGAFAEIRRRKDVF